MDISPLFTSLWTILNFWSNVNTTFSKNDYSGLGKQPAEMFYVKKLFLKILQKNSEVNACVGASS